MRPLGALLLSCVLANPALCAAVKVVRVPGPRIPLSAAPGVARAAGLPALPTSVAAAAPRSLPVAAARTPAPAVRVKAAPPRARVAFRRAAVPLRKALRPGQSTAELGASLDGFFSGSKAPQGRLGAGAPFSAGKPAGPGGRLERGAALPVASAQAPPAPESEGSEESSEAPSLGLFYAGLALGLSYYAILPLRWAGYRNLATEHSSNLLWSFMGMALMDTMGRAMELPRELRLKWSLLSASAILLYNAFHEWVTNVDHGTFDRRDMAAGALGVLAYFLADITLSAWKRRRAAAGVRIDDPAGGTRKGLERS